MSFRRQCQLRVDAYCRAFGLDRVIVPEDEDRAIETLKTVAGVCQPTPEAMAAVADAEEQWAIDWLMDPRPDPPQGVQCAIDYRLILGGERIKSRAKHARLPTLAGWPIRWCLPPAQDAVFPECFAPGCRRERESGDLCPHCLEKLRHLRDVAHNKFGVCGHEADRLADLAVKRPNGVRPLTLMQHVLGNDDRHRRQRLVEIYEGLRMEAKNGL